MANTKNGAGSPILVLAAAMLGGVGAGLIAARFIVRKEIERFRSETSEIVTGREPSNVKETEAGTQLAELAEPHGEEQVAVTTQPAPAKEEITAETLAILSATVAAYLGKRARVRSARVLYSGANPWAQAGRVSIQASHDLSAVRSRERVA